MLRRNFKMRNYLLVDEIYELDEAVRDAKVKGDNLRAEKNKLSGEIGKLMRDGKKEEAEDIKKKIADMDAQIKILEVSFEKKNALIKEKNDGNT
ncbi:MAG: hypothetical protein L6V78_06760 [Clostridium sp.]|nr:MAG: hypothetical protein L6V78_06760 [Clostridium sp.]